MMPAPAGSSTTTRWLLIGALLGIVLLVVLINLRSPSSGREHATASSGIADSGKRSEPRRLPPELSAPSAAASAPMSDERVSAVPEALAATESAPPFEFALLPPEEGFAESPLVYTGLGNLSEIDWKEYLIAASEGAGGAGPESIAELSHVAGWQPTEPVRGEDGIQTVQPGVEAGAHYVHLLAITTDRRWWYEAQVPMARVASGGRFVVRPRGVTGLILTIDPPPSQPVQAHFHRLQARGGRVDGQLTLLQDLVAPYLYDAHRGESAYLLDSAGPHLLAPLHADGAVALRLRTLTGRPLETDTIPLRAGELIAHNLSIDLDAGNLADLSGLVLEAGTRLPIPRVAVHAQADPELYRGVSDAEGTFLIEHLETGMEYGFELRLPAPEDGRRPSYPDQLTRTVRIPTASELNGLPHEVVWEVPAYRWLVLELPGPPELLAAAPMTYPFPVYILSRLRDDSSEWRPRRADHFIVEGREVSVSIVEDGAYSVRVALSPLEYLESEPAVFGARDSERRVTLDRRASPRTSELVVRAINGAGEPWRGAQLRVMAPIGLPFPVVLATDREGMATVGWASHGVLDFELEFTDGRDYVLKREFNGESPLELVFDESTLAR